MTCSMKSNTFKKQNGAGLKFAIVRARFNEEITKGLLDGARKGIRDSQPQAGQPLAEGVMSLDVMIVEVPGSFEIPLQVKRLAAEKKYDVVIALGAIIKGETKHDEYIANAVIPALMQIGLQYNVPVMLGIITPLNLEQARARSAADDHNVGYQAVLAAVEVCGLHEARNT